MEKQKRIAYIDVAKAFTISLIVYFHTIDKFSLTNIFPPFFSLYTIGWMMPLFAILSGIFFSVDVTWSTFLRKKSRQLILPLFSWSFFALLIDWLLYDVYMSISKGNLPHFGSYVEYMWGMVSDRGWWFLRSLFFCFLYAYFSLKLFRRHYLFGLIFSICFLYFLSFSGIIPNRYRLFIGFIYLYPFFCLGILYKRYLPFIEKHRFSLLCFVTFFLIIFVTYSSWSGYADSFYPMNTSVRATSGYANIIGFLVIKKTISRFILGTLFSFLIILLLYNIQYTICNYNLLSSVRITKKIVLWIGGNTLPIYILHLFVLHFIPKDLFSFSHGGASLGCILYVALIFLTFLVVRLTSLSRMLSLLLWGKRINNGYNTHF